jgi:hypothetical protein
MTEAQLHHNLPPDMTVTANETAAAISEWLSENPVIENEEQARIAKVFIDRGKLCLKDMETERDAAVRPLNSQVENINARYRAPRNVLTKVTTEIVSRVSAFLRTLERSRLQAAEEARRRAEEAEHAAREAERREHEAIEEAASGVVGGAISDLVVDADTKFEAYKKATHQAQIAERDSKVKIGGGFSRAIGLKEKETLVVTNYMAALMEMGSNEDINEAIIRSARAFRKLTGHLPCGVESKTERRV